MAEVAGVPEPSGSLPPKMAIAGVPISLTSYDEVLDVIGRRPADRALVIAVCNVHSVMSARRDAALCTMRSAKPTLRPPTACLWSGCCA